MTFLRPEGGRRRAVLPDPAVAAAFRKRRGHRQLSSTRAFQLRRDTESYSAAKGGITALTHALAVSLAGIARVNAIAPAGFDTAEQPHPGPDSAQHPCSAWAAGRFAAAVLLPVRGHSGFITGQTLAVRRRHEQADGVPRRRGLVAGRWRRIVTMRHDAASSGIWRHFGKLFD